MEFPGARSGIRDELLFVHSGESESLVFLFFFYNGGHLEMQQTFI